MRADDFELLLGLLSRLTVEQKDRLRVSLAAGDQEAAVVELLVSGLVRIPVVFIVVRRGHAMGVQPWPAVLSLQELPSQFQCPDRDTAFTVAQEGFLADLCREFVRRIECQGGGTLLGGAEHQLSLAASFPVGEGGRQRGAQRHCRG